MTRIWSGTSVPLGICRRGSTILSAVVIMVGVLVLVVGRATLRIHSLRWWILGLDLLRERFSELGQSFLQNISEHFLL